jgi:hypothetical protein
MFVPFALETYGGLDVLAIELLRDLAVEAEMNLVSSKEAFLARCRRQISLALARGNALVSAKGARAAIAALYSSR